MAVYLVKFVGGIDEKLLLIVLCITTLPCFSWDGYDYDRGDYIEIERGNLVRVGNDIEIYDYSTGTYKDVEVQSFLLWASYY